MEHIDESTELEVGKFYKVRCAKIHITDDKYMFVPILGSEHKDPQIGANFNHYHIDGRFNGPYHDRYTLNHEGKTNNVIATEFWGGFSGIEIKRKRCARLTTGIKPPDRIRAINLSNYLGKQYYDWYDSMIGKSCKGRKCPHLGTIMQEINGVLVCPLHNLHGCIETELIIKEI